MSTGLNYDEVRTKFDLPRLKAMNKYWESFPPVHVMVAGYLGIKPSEKAPELSNDEQLIQLMQALGQG